MRGCERGAGSADRAPAPAHPHRGGAGVPATHTRGAILSTTRTGEAVLRDNWEDIQPQTFSEEALVRNSGESVLPRTCRGEAIVKESGGILPQTPQETILRINRESVPPPPSIHHDSSDSNISKLKGRGEIIKPQRYEGKTILRYRRKSVLSDSEDALLRHGGKTVATRKRKNIRELSTGGTILKHRETILPRRTRGGAILLCVLLLLSLRGSRGSGSLGAQLVCARAPLTEKQRALCRASPAAMAAVAAGLRMAYAECRSQLAGRRWNCSGVGDSNHFGHVISLATREAAFTYAITSAGVTHALSAACARGALPACGCTHRRRAGPQWEWGGGGASAARCGETAWGARLARRFLDARELENDARAAMNLHNNRLGRKMVKELVRRECKCHGVSGSCAVRTCWRALPPFRALGAALRDKYSRAKLVTAVEHGTSDDGRLNIQLFVKRPRQAGAGRAARKHELVFLAPSPTYCEPDAAAGALGTRGRRCNNTSRGEEGCGSLCCGRGYSTVRRAERVQCRCQFQWCCRVRCDTCLATTEHHVCN